MRRVFSHRAKLVATTAVACTGAATTTTGVGAGVGNGATVGTGCRASTGATEGRGIEATSMGRCGTLSNGRAKARIATSQCCALRM